MFNLHTILIITMQKIIKIVILLLAVFVSPLSLSATETEKAKTDNELDITTVIFDHILDSHEWHIMTLNEGKENEKHIVVPLPVILYDNGKIVTFMSSAF